jgi:hypothetical protein
MTLQELFDLLDELINHENVDPDMPVMVAYQPDYPLEAEIANVKIVKGEDELNVTCYIACHQQNDYAPRSAWEED